MERMTGSTLMCLKSKDAFVLVYGIAQCVTGSVVFNILGGRHFPSGAVNLYGRLGIGIAVVQSDPTADDTFVSDDGRLDLLPRRHDGEHRDHSCFGEIDMSDGPLGRMQYLSLRQANPFEVGL